MEQYFCLYQSGQMIYGIGTTPEAAQEDANEWLQPPRLAQALESYQGEIAGALYIRPCTAALYHHVRTEGGHVHYALNNDGSLDLVAAAGSPPLVALVAQRDALIDALGARPDAATRQRILAQLREVLNAIERRYGR